MISKLSLILLLFVFTNAASASFCRDHLKSQKSVFASNLSKYNSDTVLNYHFSVEGLKHAELLYHQLPVSPIVKGIMMGEDSQHNLLMAQAPNYFVWNKTNDTFLSVNPTYFTADKLIKAVKANTVKTLKSAEEGIAFVSWFVHPQLLNRLQQSANQKLKIIDLETTGKRYLVSILDLRKEDLSYLKELKQLSLNHLNTKFGVTEKDNVRLDFHFPYAVDNATLHLHVRVNTPTHPLELAKSYTIDEVISYLESGKSTRQMILERQGRLGGFHFLIDAGPILSLLPGGQVLEVQNPFRKIQDQ